MNLYNKYRPTKFKEVLGQNCIKILEAQVATNSHSSTYLLSGTSGVGKTTIARIVAMALMCENRKDGESEPCGECQSCKQIVSDNNRDVMEINCAIDGGVNKVRDIIAEHMLIAPSMGNYRIFILDESHQLTNSAQNALLKIMEEPPRYVKFFLCTTDVHKILNTIKTRCQHFSLKRLSEKDLLFILQKVVKEECIECDTNGINLIIQSSNGSPRSALSLLDSIAAIGATEDNIRIALSRAPRQISINLLKAICTQNRSEAYKIIMAANAEGRDLPALLEECVRILVNDIARCKLLHEKSNDKDIIELSDKESGFKGPHIVDISTKLLEINSKIRQNVPAELIIPVGILNVIDRFTQINKNAKS
jgi:DNA polymerase-3 subunit gamma/tau